MDRIFGDFRFLRGLEEVDDGKPKVYTINIHNSPYTWTDSIWTTREGAEGRAAEITEEARKNRAAWHRRKGSIVTWPLDEVPPPPIDDGIN